MFSRIAENARSRRNNDGLSIVPGLLSTRHTLKLTIAKSHTTGPVVWLLAIVSFKIAKMTFIGHSKSSVRPRTCDTVTHWPKIVQFSYPPTRIWEPSWRWSCRSFVHRWGHRKIEWQGYQVVKKNFDEIQQVVLIQYGSVPDRRTDRQTIGITISISKRTRGENYDALPYRCGIIKYRRVIEIFNIHRASRCARLTAWSTTVTIVLLMSPFRQVL